MNPKKAAMAISAAGVMAIAGFEGYRSLAYQPLEGDKWTIGFGHTGDVQPGQTIDLRRAALLLRKDVQWAEEVVNEVVEPELTQNQFDALVSFVYNVGPTQFQRSTLLACLNAGDFTCVEGQWMRWVYFKGKPVDGLRNRRARELAIFNGEKPTVDSTGAICFGDAGCLRGSDLLQEATRDPDGASCF